MEATITMFCSDCDTKIEHNYTADDITPDAVLEFTCPNCGVVINKTGSQLLDEIKQAVIAALS